MDVATYFTQFGTVEENVSFTSLTTLRTGGNARYVVYPNSSFSLQSIVDYCLKNEIPYKVFGNGSNILCSDKNYDGVIIKLNRNFNNYYFENDVLVAEAGCSIISLAAKAMTNSLSGLEFASGIPGSLGGCIYMNAGAYKGDMSQIVTEVQVLKDNQILWLSNKECQFSYRHSIFADSPIVILAAKLQLTKGDKNEIFEKMESRKEKRMATQPLDKPSAGSFFRNPENNFAWKLIDGIGYRGKRIGGAMVSEKHSNFIINAGKATSSEIMMLSQQIIEQVKDKYGVELIMEVERFNW